MANATTRPAIPKPAAMALFILVLLTFVGVSFATGSDIALEDAKPASGNLSVDERTYYEFVSPRLDRLVIEVDQVADMVHAKSRDIIALTVSGDRITRLTDEILDFGRTNGVPERFALVHERIESGSDSVNATFAQARKALRTFDFSIMTTLVSEFDSAAQILHSAQDLMIELALDPATILGHLD